jgi:hypothetical protein
MSLTHAPFMHALSLSLRVGQRLVCLILLLSLSNAVLGHTRCEAQIPLSFECGSAFD